jgi:hypothetical protein
MASQPYALMGTSTTSVATGAGNTVLTAAVGRLCTVVVTTAGTGSTPVLFYDNASAASGTVIAAIPGTVSVGTVFQFNQPVVNGIVVANVANGPVLSCAWH